MDTSANPGSAKLASRRYIEWVPLMTASASMGPCRYRSQTNQGLLM
jgi:hypothetical protein